MKKAPAKHVPTRKEGKSPSKRIAATTPKKRAKAPSKPSTRPAAALSLGKHVHPYGTPKHTDLDWHLQRFEDRVATFDESAAASVRDALAFAKQRHEGQLRKGGGEYVIHPVRIANILMYEWSTTDPVMVSAALLHDVVEDTQTTIKEVKDSFGNDVGKLVDGMTMWKGSETYETYVKRVSRGPEPLRVLKCADALDNLRSWYETNGDEFQRWWRNTHDLILPISKSVEDEGTAAMAIARVLDDPWYLKKAGME